MTLTTTTEKNILLFIYKELTPKKEAEIKALLETNELAKQYYLSLVTTCKQLDTLLDSPQETSLKIISETAHNGYSETV